MGNYYVYDGNLHGGKWFKEFKNQKTELTDNPGEAMAFVNEHMAEDVAAHLKLLYGGPWEVFDPWETLAETDAVERLLRAIFGEDGEDDG